MRLATAHRPWTGRLGRLGALSALIAWSASMALAGCSGRGGPVPDANTPQEDVGPLSDVLPDRLPDRLADRLDHEGLPDAGPLIYDPRRPQGNPVPGCQDPVWPIPNHGNPNNRVIPRGLRGTELVYYVEFGINPHAEAFYVDLADCMEYPLTQIAPPGNHPVPVSVSHGIVLLSAALQPEYHKVLYELDVRTWRIRVLTEDHPGNVLTVVTGNSDWAATFRAPTLADRSYSLSMINLDSLDTTDVTSFTMAYSYLAMTDDILVFEPTAWHCASGSATWYLDLHDFSLSMVPWSCDDATEHLYTASGYRLTWMQETWDSWTYTCVVGDLEQNWHIVLTQDDPAPCVGGVDRDIVLWDTGLEATEAGQKDIWAMDLSNGLKRKLTSEPRNAGATSPMSLPRALVYGQRHNVNAPDIYVANLQALGVVDADGHLLAGPPVDELSDLGDP